MSSTRQLFLEKLAQTSTAPLLLEIEKAEGIYLYDSSGKSYMDLISGIAVSNVGHRHPKVVEAIKTQVDKYMHLMVYGEYIQQPQVKLAALLAEILPQALGCTYFVNSGSEAIEGAMKLAKRYTGRTEIISFKNAYHGSTQGALSIMGDEYFKNAYRPLLPDIRILEFNNETTLHEISEKTACVVVETIQGEAGVRIPAENFLKKLREKCNITGTLLILDEIQCGFGRTGKMFAFEHYNIVPDILCLAKAMGGGMPIGAFIASKEIMSVLKENPALGHITTFGGHPVSCAASYAAIKVIIEENLTEQIPAKENLFKELLKHPLIKEIRGKGLFLAIQLETPELMQKVINECIKNGLLLDWFLFCGNAIRIAPPLTITAEEIEKACSIIIKSLNII